MYVNNKTVIFLPPFSIQLMFMTLQNVDAIRQSENYKAPQHFSRAHMCSSTPGRRQAQISNAAKESDEEGRLLILLKFMECDERNVTIKHFVRLLYNIL